MAARTAARRRQVRGLQGVTRLRRTLRRMPEAVTKDVRDAIGFGAESIHFDMVRLVPKDTGDLASRLTTRISRDGLTALIGLVTKPLQRMGFYARFIEFGTKGSAKQNTPAQPARPFMSPAFMMNKNEILQRVQRGIRKALRWGRVQGIDDG